MITAILSDLQIYYLNLLTMFCIIEWVWMKSFSLCEVILRLASRCPGHGADLYCTYSTNSD